MGLGRGERPRRDWDGHGRCCLWDAHLFPGLNWFLFPPPTGGFFFFLALKGKYRKMSLPRRKQALRRVLGRNWCFCRFCAAAAQLSAHCLCETAPKSRVKEFIWLVSQMTLPACQIFTSLKYSSISALLLVSPPTRCGEKLGDLQTELLVQSGDGHYRKSGDVSFARSFSAV